MKPFLRSSCLPVIAFLAFSNIVSSSRILAFGGPPGGPFGNGNYFPNDGTFSAVIRGTNLSGILQFSTTEGVGPVPSSIDSTTTGIGNSAQTLTVQRQGSGGIGSTGIANIYFNGSFFKGNSQGAFNSTDSGMEVTFQAEAEGTGSGQIVVSRRYVSTTTTNGTTTTTQETLPIYTLTYYDSKTLNGYANCKTSNSFPNQKFKGSGEVVVQELDFKDGNSNPEVLTYPPMDITVTGVRLSNNASDFFTETITSPSVINTTILTNP